MNDMIFGRMPNGLDESDFDALPINSIDIPTNYLEEDTVEGEDAPASAADLVRIDSENTHAHYLFDKAIKEISRRLDELRAAFEHHLEEEHHLHPALSRWDEVLGAVTSVEMMRKAKSTDDIVDAMPTVNADLPEFANGKVKCWKEGDHVVCSMRFSAPDGSKRFATATAKPKVAPTDVVGMVLAGAAPDAVFDAADAVCAKRLVRDVAGAALASCARETLVGGMPIHHPIFLPKPKPKKLIEQ